MTSLASLAASPSSHPPSSSSYIQPSAVNTTAPATSASIELNDTNYEIRSEFYTREGIWKLVSDYSRPSLASSSFTAGNATISTTVTTSPVGGTGSVNNNNNTSTPNQNYSILNPTSNNDPVKVALFKFSANMLNSVTNHDNSGVPVIKNYGKACAACTRLGKSGPSFHLKPDEYDDEDDDDNDVIVSKLSINENSGSMNSGNSVALQAYFCKYCKASLNENGETVFSQPPTLSSVNEQSDNLSFDFVLFNYAREVYAYEFNPIQLSKQEGGGNDSQGPFRKRSYKTYMSTCLDVNKAASTSNTVLLQTKRSAMGSQQSASGNNLSTVIANHQNQTLNEGLFIKSIAFSSLIVATGFNKGEIHVFDAFKPDASVFYNNTKLIDKSKVTCIKWLPNSVNMFLAGYSSGNIYLYDANDQTQPTGAPSYTKLCQTDSFSIFINNSSTPSSSNLVLPSDYQYNSPGVKSGATMPKLVLSNASQPVPVAKNPLVQLTIGSAESTAYGVNGVNEFAFSPCGQFLAVVSQDGYMRVFRFVYQNQQQMQIELRCSMKSYFGGLLCVCWSPDGKYIVTGGEDDLITVFSFIDMRVACRGRGHSSWINCCAFDPWSSLSDCSSFSYLNFISKAKNQNKSKNADTSTNAHDDDDSDLDDLQNSSLNKNNDAKLKRQLLLEIERNSKITAPKKRTISTLSDFSSPAGVTSTPATTAPTATNNTTTSANLTFYRLASVGQDNQLCFWDLTEDVLKAKSTAHHSRSRVTSIHTTANQQSQASNNHYNLPQVVIQQANETSTSSSTDENSLVSGGGGGTSSTTTSKPLHHHHHSTTSSIVSSARNFFSSKHSDKSFKVSNSDHHSNDEGEERINSRASTGTVGGFFKRHRRQSSLTTPVGSANSSSSIIGEKQSIKMTKSSQVVLNSYKKSANMFTNEFNYQANPHSSSSSSVSQTLTGVVTNHLPTELGINSLSSNRLSSASTHSAIDQDTRVRISSGSANHPFNICPKLDEVPLIEPLICKRIANERLSSIVFRDDCFVVASQDGFVYTWARPNSHQHIQPPKYMTQASLESRYNSTNL